MGTEDNSRLLDPLSSTESEAWAMSAFAAKLCKARGAYRVYNEPNYVYLTFGKPVMRGAGK